MVKKSSNVLKKILCAIIILLFLMFICIYALYFFMQIEENNNDVDIQVTNYSNLETIQDVIEKYESVYLNQDGRKIYVDFKVDLYGENGKSNKQYFENLINELTQLEELEKSDFSLIDKEKMITITVRYDFELEKYIISYNNIENFYDVTDGKSYTNVDKVKIIDKIKLYATSKELSSLIADNMFFKSIVDTIGEGIELDNGYISYQDGKILLKMVDYRVKSIIFTEKYQDTVFSGIKVGTDLEKLQKEYEGFEKGSLEEGYLVYRTKDIYAFFYEDEIIVYGYSYFENELFEEWLEEYLQNKNLKTFIERVTTKWINYEICEYDFDMQYAHITYPSRGVEINIKDNNSLGITLYNNYYFTDKTKKFVKDGKISLKESQDYLEITERSRRENFEK